MSKDAGYLAGSEKKRDTLITGKLYAFDRMHGEAGKPLMGIDEAGRGPLAGPVVAAAVVLDLDTPIEGINDSKQLSAKQRERLYPIIVESAQTWAIGVASSEEIDRINILQATFAAMFRAVSALSIDECRILVDGNRIVPQLPAVRQTAVVGGDACSASIAAASILAKVTRDRMMVDFHRQYPLYQFDRHKGYGTALHRDLIRQYGICQLHRKSFCSEMLLQTTLAF